MQKMRFVALCGSLFIYALLAAGPAAAAPYAAMVIDARSGEVLHSRNADTRLHPASLTKMMTLYVAFEAVRRGEITLDTNVTVSRHAASEPPSKLYLKAGQKIALRHLIRAASVKSANDAATAIGEAISGSEAAFAARMTRTAQALGMSQTTFKNAHGLTQTGHMSTARDMTTLGRHLFYDYPEYYNLFSRRTTNAGGTKVANTNRRLLNAYRGADGIKTGYTRAAGFNLVASAERGQERIIATVFGGSSGAARNKRVAELLDMGFSRAPSRVAVRKPARPLYSGGSIAIAAVPASPAPSRTIVVASSPRPKARRSPAPALVVAAAAVEAGVNQALQAAQLVDTELGADGGVMMPRARQGDAAPVLAALPEAALAGAEQQSPDPAIEVAVAPTGLTTGVAVARAAVDAAILSASAFVPPVTDQTRAAASRQASASVTVPSRRPARITFSSPDTPAPETELAVAEVLTPHVSTSGGRNWGIKVGTYGSRYEAERVLLKTALIEIGTLDSALRRVVQSRSGFEANFVGLDERSATLACRRLSARQPDCAPFRS